MNIFRPKLAILAAAAGCVLASPPMAHAQDKTYLKKSIEALRKDMQSMRRAYEWRIKRMQRRIELLEMKSTTAKGQVRHRPRKNAGATATANKAASARRPSPNKTQKRPAKPTATVQLGPRAKLDLMFGVSASVVAGGSSASRDNLGTLLSGHHDPKQNGIGLQNLEVFFGGTVDPYFAAKGTITVQVTPEGETEIELEELYLTTRSLPYGLQAKFGLFYADFGRGNQLHQHQRSFVDTPFVLTRIFGDDGLRNPAASIAWLTPLPWFSEVVLGTMMPTGETASSFFGEAGEDVAGFVRMDRSVKHLRDMVYFVRWVHGFDISPTVATKAGLSFITGPNSTGRRARTYIFGGDIFVKWRPEKTQRGFPFVAVTLEALYRIFEGADTSDPTHAVLRDYGLYAQLVWGVRPGWAAGLRVGWAQGSRGSSADPLRNNRLRLSLNLTWLPSEFSLVRLQYNHDRAPHLPGGSAHSVWLQLQISLGDHFAHKF